MGKTAKKLLCVMMALLLALPFQMITVRAAEADEITTLKANVVDEQSFNYFSYTAYSGKSWTLNADESYVDLGTSDSRAEECYYEIHFRGNGIRVYAIKASVHGKVRFTVDGANSQDVDLYNSSRITEKVFEASGLSEGDHVLKAVTLPEKSGSKIVNQVAYAEIIHQPYTGGTPNLGGSIEDTNTQYTQDRYSEIAARNTTSASLTAWKNDKAVSELVLYSKNCSLTNVRIEASDLTNGSDMISKDNVTATFIKSTKAYNGSYLGYGSTTREVPAATGANRSEASDILYQTSPIDIGFQKLQPVWVEFNIPKDARAGNYTGTLKATADGIEQPLTFTYQVTVQNATLPDIEEMAGTFDVELWQYPYSSAEYYGVTPFSAEHLEIMRSSMLKYKEVGGHAITATILEEAWNGQTYSANDVHYPSMIKWTKNSDGSFSYDYTDFDKWVEFCKSLGIGDKIVLYSIAPWHSSFTYWENGTLKYEAFTAGSDRYNTVWTAFLEDLIAHLEQKGWFEESYIGIDERGFSQAAFDLVDSVKNSQGVSLKTAGAMDNFVNKRDLAMRVDDLNVGDNAAAAHQAEFAQLLTDREAAGLRTTLYSCTEHRPGNFALSAPVESYWSIINAGKSGTAGFLRWAYDAWVADPLNDATHNAFEPGDCFLIYPAEKDAADKTCKSSVRLERMAEGVRDVNKLLIIEKEAPQLAGEIEKLYDGIQTTASTGRTYLNDAERTRLAEEMNTFKAGVAELTTQYLATTSDGLYILSNNKEMFVNDTWQLPVSLRTEEEDKTILYKSADASIAAIDANGVVTARKTGSTTITAIHEASGYQDTIEVTVTKKPLNISNKLKDYRLPEQYLSDIEKDPENEKGRRYLGQPDMIMLDDNQTLFTVYPVGHGVGRIVMQVSRDGGETWTEKTDIPESWSTSYETPTIYKLNMTDGTTKLIVISGRPANFGAATGGWDTSISTDNGETWSEYQTYCEYFADGTTRNDTVVAMASLVQLKDEEGNYIDKWMGVYHDGNTFVNYKTYLTFDEAGNQQWTTPVPYLSEYRSIEWSHQICEVGMFRSPDGNRIVALARNQSHNGPATMFYSDDEGDTWSEPVELPGSLAGERHKAMYDPTDPTGQRMIVTFREICYDLNGNNLFDGNSDWLAGDWVAWVGTYDQLMNLEEGQFRILLCEDWAHNAKSGDTGYTGIVVQPDGTFIMDTYGHWDKDYWVEKYGSLNGYNVRQDLCYIKQAKFKLSDLDELVIPDLKTNITNEIEKGPSKADASKYTEESWQAYQEALKQALEVQGSSESTQNQCYAAESSLKDARLSLVMKEKKEPEPDERDEAKKALADVMRQAGAYTDASKYEAESWKQFQAALAHAKSVQSDAASTKEQIEAAMNALKSSMQGLKAAGGTSETENPIQAGKTYTCGNYTYKVTDVSKRTVAVTGIEKSKLKKIKKITVYNSVKLGGKDYTVTSIADSAFRNNKRVTGASISKNVQSIGKNAFAGCTKLKKVTTKGNNLRKIGSKAFFQCRNLKSLTIKSKVLKSVGKNAFKGIHRKAVIKVPASKYKVYVKKLAKKGQSKTVKIKK